MQRLLNLVAHNQQRVLAQYQQVNQLPSNSFASSSLDFQSRLLTKFGAKWLDSEDASSTMAVAMELGMLVLADPDTLPRRSAASFFAAFAELTTSKDGHENNNQARLNEVLHAFGPRVLASVLRLLGGECARSEIESITEVLKRFVQKHFMLTKSILHEAIKDDQGVMTDRALKATTIERRTRFLAQIESLRGSRKTNDIVKEFWVACRGSSFGYIA
jgi:hypothetical protein